VQAAELAISSPLLEASIDGAHGVLLSIQGGSDLGLFEINEAARLVQEAAHPEANIIFGAVIDDALGDEVRVTVIAAGFDGGGPVKRGDDRALGQIAGSHGRGQAQEQPRQQSYQQQQPRSVPPVPTHQQQAPAQQPQPSQQPQPVQQQPQPQQAPAPEPVRQQQEPVARPPRTVTFDDNDDLDVPDFLK
jgi:cell division protein FtsZ